MSLLIIPQPLFSCRLIEEGVISIRGAARRFGVPYSTILCWMQKSSDRRPHSLRTGRPRKLSKRSRRRLIRIATTSYEGRRLKWKELRELAGLDVSGKTIKRACEKEGYHKCKACRKPFLSVKAAKIEGILLGFMAEWSRTFGGRLCGQMSVPLTRRGAPLSG